MKKLKLLPVGNRLDVERALTETEKHKLLDAADLDFKGQQDKGFGKGRIAANLLDQQGDLGRRAAPARP